VIISWFHPCSANTNKYFAALGQDNGLLPSAITHYFSPLKFQGGKAIFRVRKFSAVTSLSKNRKSCFMSLSILLNHKIINLLYAVPFQKARGPMTVYDFFLCGYRLSLKDIFSIGAIETFSWNIFLTV
jgi:hypothetical protein